MAFSCNDLFFLLVVQQLMEQLLLLQAKHRLQVTTTVSVCQTDVAVSAE